MPILFSIPFGRNTECAIKRSLNVLEFIPDAIVIANCDKAIDREGFKNAVGGYFETSIFMNPIPRSQNKDANLLEAHLRNYLFAKEQGMKFDYVCLLSDQDMFFRKGVYELVKHYDAGFMVCTSFLKPNDYKENGFAEGTLWNQKAEPFWTEGILPISEIQRIYSDQIEGSFYKRELFDKMLQYIEALPVHYTSIEKSHYEEVTFGTLYLNLFRKEFPLWLPVSIIYRSNDITFREKDLFHIMIGEREVESMPTADGYPTFHTNVYGIKRVNYLENWDMKVKNMVAYSRSFLEAKGITHHTL
jgi:hypothetical protein